MQAVAHFVISSNANMYERLDRTSAAAAAADAGSQVPPARLSMHQQFVFTFMPMTLFWSQLLPLWNYFLGLVKAN
jgi:hypothetical protein